MFCQKGPKKQNVIGCHRGRIKRKLTARFESSKTNKKIAQILFSGFFLIWVDFHFIYIEKIMEAFAEDIICAVVVARLVIKRSWILMLFNFLNLSFFSYLYSKRCKITGFSFYLCSLWQTKLNVPRINQAIWNLSATSRSLMLSNIEWSQVNPSTT